MTPVRNPTAAKKTARTSTASSTGAETPPAQGSAPTAVQPLAAFAVVRGQERAAALLEPTRQLLLLHLTEPDSAAGLARRLGQPRQRINYHLRELEQAGLVELVSEQRKGNCVERLVRATARAFVISPEVLGELGLPPATVADRASAVHALQAAARVLREVGVLEANARSEGKRLATWTLDTEIRFKSAAARAAFAADLASAIARLIAQYHDEQAPAGRRFRLTALVHPVLTQPEATPTASRPTASAAAAHETPQDPTEEPT